ncbi:MAG: acyl-CoA dehydrogenase family protein [Acidiferrobacterales bacterium]|nr:acyl-CoA dehydrogenase family protein [Acidiferrobacterales bacterium]
MNLSSEQELIRDSIRGWSQEVLAPGAAERDQSSRFPAEELKSAAELGIFGMTVPVDWEGAGADMVSLAIALEEIAAADGACSTILSVNNSVVCGPLLTFGDEWQKEHYLRDAASGRKLGCFCLTEPEAGSDASSIRSRAQKNGEGYVLNGTKQFITSGKNADIAIVFAVTNPTAGKRGISAFIVDTDNPGFQVSRVEQKLGQRSSDTAQIVLDQCQVPASNLLGQEGEGYKIALANLESGRIGIAAQCVGMARAAYDAALDYAKERKAFGKALIEHQGTGFKLADMATQLEAARLLVLNAAQRKDDGLPCLTEASMAKLFASETAEKICSDAIQVLGGYGYLRDFPVERIYRDVRVGQLYEGTSEIQRWLISRSITTTMGQ